MAGKEVSAVILRNKGCPVSIHPTVLNEDGGWSVASNAKGEPQVETTWIRFDSNGIADIEECFGTLELFQQASGLQPTTTLRKVLAIAFGWDYHDQTQIRRAGLAMLPGKIDDYATAISVALAIANGMDPTKAAEILEVGVSAAEVIRREQGKVVEESLVQAKKVLEETDASPGPSGPEPGVESAGQ